MRTDADHFMKRALRLALRGAGRVSPNPMVGAVIVRDDRIVGEGYHVYERRDHAEVVALRQAGDLARGADLYINLEPCTHFGRTPPCVESVIKAGIRRAFIATRDPNPLVSGQGVARLLESGIEVQEGLCQEEAASLNEKFFHFIQTRRPFVLLKLALTLDGRIATASGESRWITGERARQVVHRFRYEYDALLVGINTVLQDNPSLDTRGPRKKKPLTKVILDSGLRTPIDARVFSSPGRVVIFHDSAVSEERIAHLRDKALLFSITSNAAGLDWNCITRLLGEQGITSLMIEGGGQVAASALSSAIVQRIALFYAPKLLGAEALPAIGKIHVERLSDAVTLDRVQTRRLGADLLVEGYPKAWSPRRLLSSARPPA